MCAARGLSALGLIGGFFLPAARVSAARDPPPVSKRRPGHRPAALRCSVSSICAATNRSVRILAARRPARGRAAPPRASSSRQRARGGSRRPRSSNHRGAGDFYHPGLLASRLFALWVEGPTRRSTDLSSWASPAWRAHFLYHWRVEPGTRTAPILGHRVVRVRWYPARSLKPAAGIAAVTSLPATGRTLRSGVGLDQGGVRGGGMPPPVTLVAPAELS